MKKSLLFLILTFFLGNYSPLPVKHKVHTQPPTPKPLPQPAPQPVPKPIPQPHTKPAGPKPPISKVYKARIGDTICGQEQLAVTKHAAIALSTLQTFLKGEKLSPQSTPLIGIACSGGGLRAAISTLGLLRGLEKIGLLKATTYLAALSGSTWTTAAWSIHNMQLNELTTYLRKNIERGFSYQGIDQNHPVTKAILKRLATLPKKFTADDYRTLLTAAWGAFGADIFLKTSAYTGHDFFLNNLQARSNAGITPIPIFTMVCEETPNNFQWIEASPFEFGSPYLKAWIEPHDVGKKFSKGISTDQNPGESLGFLLGVCTAMQAASIYEALPLFYEAIEKAIEKAIKEAQKETLLTVQYAGPQKALSLEDRPLAWRMNNFAQGLPQCPSPLRTQEKLIVVDAGFAFGIPLPPLLRRKVSLYIIGDFPESSKWRGNHLKHALEYAQKNKLPFPSIDCTPDKLDHVQVFQDLKNPAVPIVIYIPLLKEFKTAKSSYTTAEFDALMQSIESAVTKNVTLIKDAVKKAIANAAKKK